MRLKVTSVSELKSNIDSMIIYQDYVRLNIKGRRGVALCPFHREKTPSFTVDLDSGLFYCFGCHKGGDIIKFIEEIEKCSFEEAIGILCRKGNIDFDWKKEEGISDEARKKGKLYELLSEAQKYFRKALIKENENSIVRNYMEKRGIAKLSEEELQLGFTGEKNGLISTILRSGFSKEEALVVGLLTMGKNGDYYETFRERLIFPIFDLQNRVVGFGGRTLKDEEPKYLNSKESPLFKKREILYGLNLSKEHIKKEGFAIIVEGYMDFLSLYQAGIKNVVASLGTSLTINQANLLKRYTDNIVLLYDFDEAGKNASLRAIPILMNADLIVKIAILKEGKDPDEELKKIGVEKLKKDIENASDFVDFITLKMGKNFNSSLERKMEYLKTIVPLIAQVDDPLKRDLYLSEIAYKLGIKKEKIEQFLSLLGNTDKSDVQYEEIEIPVDEQIVIKALLKNEKEYFEMINEFDEEILNDMTCAQLVIKLKNGEEIVEDKLLKKLAFIKNSIFEVNSINDLRNALLSLEKRHFEKRLNELTQKIKDAQKKEDKELEKILSNELNSLIKEMKIYKYSSQ